MKSLQKILFNKISNCLTEIVKNEFDISIRFIQAMKDDSTYFINIDNLSELCERRQELKEANSLILYYSIFGNYIVLQPNFTCTKDEYNTNNYIIDIQNFKILNGPARKSAEMVIERMKKV